MLLRSDKKMCLLHSNLVKLSTIQAVSKVLGTLTCWNYHVFLLVSISHSAEDHIWCRPDMTNSKTADLVLYIGSVSSGALLFRLVRSTISNTLSWIYYCSRISQEALKNIFCFFFYTVCIMWAIIYLYSLVFIPN